MAKCNSCGADIIWVKTAKGKSMPLDPSSPDGTFVIEDGVAISAPNDGRRPLHKSHFSSCPNAAQHRKK
jgi:hypothetical protein